MADYDIGKTAVDAIVGMFGNYAGAELLALRQAVQRRLGRSDEWVAWDADEGDEDAQEALARAITRRAREDTGFTVELTDLLNHNAGIIRGGDRDRVAGRSVKTGDIHGHGTIVAGAGSRIRIGNNTYPVGGVLGALVIAAALIFYGGVKTGEHTGDEAPTLTSTSTCAEYMSQPDEVRDEAMRRIAPQVGRQVSTFSLLNLDSTCGGSGSRPLGDAMRNSLPEAK
ncbi:hypothetical protein [Micromonospora sp. CA-244673]|uniref:hypothetical protein n=1 Tax=Micromonospora sp. CA-244673 TaxID=3239958 RepID=UPI003D8DDEF1